VYCVYLNEIAFTVSSAKYRCSLWAQSPDDNSLEIDFIDQMDFIAVGYPAASDLVAEVTKGKSVVHEKVCALFYKYPLVVESARNSNFL
jgi:hypothetical protein